MHLLTFILLGAVLCLTTSRILAFELTLYPEAACRPKPDTTYRIITGPSNGQCYSLDRNPNELELLTCAQYENGGLTGPLPCSDNPIIPVSVRQENRPIPCEFYTKPGCQGRLLRAAGKRVCLSTNRVFESHKSFRCYWDKSIEVLGFVGCSDGVSTNVCVRDCGCECLEGGQRLLCGRDGDAAWKCTERALANCQLNCVCINP